MALATASGSAAVAQDDPTLPAGLTPVGAAVVTDVIDGDTVLLDDGREVRLVGTQAPKLPLGRRGFVAWPLAEDSRAALIALVDGEAVRLHTGGLAEDRHGRVLAHLERARDGLWVQGAMLRAGMARVYTFADNRAATGPMYAAEQAARADRRGIWALDHYAIRTPDTVGADIDTFQIVQGRILSAADVRGRIFLNFGDDWRTDFTVTVPPDDRETFRAAGLDPQDLEGRVIRVRGWVESFNGPVITADHPEMIEIDPTD